LSGGGNISSMRQQPVIDSADSEEEVTTTQKRKESTLTSTELGGTEEEPAKKRKIPSDGVCFNCNESGHIARECTKLRHYESSCLTCHSTAHSSKFCPKRIEQLEQDRATLLQLQSSVTSVPYQNTAYGAVGSVGGYDMLSSGVGQTMNTGGYSHYSTNPYSNYAAAATTQSMGGYVFDPVTKQYVYSMATPDETPCFQCGRLGHREKDCTAGLLRCFNCQSRGHLARDCKKAAMPSTCYNCGETGHLGRDCPSSGIRNCFICKNTGHMAAQCPTLPPRSCYNCGATTHIGRDCPKPSVRNLCFACRQYGHKASDCPFAGQPGVAPITPSANSRAAASNSTAYQTTY
jgi:cellular nucleic acid-binding protein